MWLNQDEYCSEEEGWDGFGPSEDVLRYHRFHLSLPLRGGQALHGGVKASLLPAAHSTFNVGYNEDLNDPQYGDECRSEIQLDFTNATPDALALFKAAITTLQLLRPRHAIDVVSLAQQSTPSQKHSNLRKGPHASRAHVLTVLERLAERSVSTTPQIFVLHSVRPIFRRGLMCAGPHDLSRLVTWPTRHHCWNLCIVPPVSRRGATVQCTSS